jgi:arylsulfatase A-like enzyme
VFHGDDPTPVPIDGYQTDGLFDIAVDCLRQRGSAPSRDPFFMVLSVEAPHPPQEAPDAYIDRVRCRGIVPRANVRPGPPEDGCEYPSHARLPLDRYEDKAIAYYAQVENLDDNMGRLMEVLDETGLAEDTVVFFFSDHGEFLGSHGLHSKQDPREESVNIPFIVYGPVAGIAGGRVLTEPICTEDIYPTTMALAGLPLPGDKPGLDLCPYMRGETAELPRDAVYLELVEEHRPPMVFYRNPWRGLRTRRYKYTTLSGRPWQLFDLEADPYEMENLVASPDHAQLVERLHGRLADMVRETGDSYELAPVKETA